MTLVTSRSAAVASALASLAAASLATFTDASVVLSNLPGSNASGTNSGNRAMKFTTGSGSWTLESATVYAYSSGTLFMEIWTDAAGTLGSVFATGSMGPNPFPWTTGDKTATFTGTTLAGNTNYWLVFGNTGPFSATLTYDTSTVATQQNLSGWIGYGTSLDYNYSTATWNASATSTWFAINAVPAPGAAGLAACALFARSRRRRR